MRYLRHEGIIEHDPSSLAVAPRKEQRVPAHLTVDEMLRVLDMPDATTPLGRRAPLELGVLRCGGLAIFKQCRKGVQQLIGICNIALVQGKLVFQKAAR